MNITQIVVCILLFVYLFIIIVQQIEIQQLKNKIHRLAINSYKFKKERRKLYERQFKNI